MVRKKICKLAVTLFILLCASFVMHCEASAISEEIFITVKVNGNCIKTDAKPYIKDNRTFVSIRFIAEALGADIEWVDEEKKAVFTLSSKVEDGAVIDKTIAGAYEEKTIELFVGSSKLTVNGVDTAMDTQTEISNGRTMVPVRFISENLNCSIEWDELVYTVSITNNDAVVPAACIDNRYYTDDDIIWLARIISVEARGLSVEGKLAVANVVVNRMKSNDFPNTIHDVISQKDYNVQFPPAHKEGFRESVPSRQCFIVAKMALEGINNIENCLFFNNRPFNSKSITLFKIIEGEYFYKKKN